MQIERVIAAYFSPTGTTKLMASIVADELASSLGVSEHETIDFTLPQARTGVREFDASSLVVMATPVYAGRVPNKIAPFVRDGFAGGGALAVPVVCFGNRAYDDALSELRAILTERGFKPCAAAAFACRHTFSQTLGAGRPDDADKDEARNFARDAAARIKAWSTPPEVLHVDGRDPVGPYYQPQRADGTPIDIRKVKPVVSDACTRCGLCATLCPMGSISADDPTQTPGICIKCCACVRCCPVGARSFDDEKFIYHRTDLEQRYERRAENAFFFAD